MQLLIILGLLQRAGAGNNLDYSETVPEKWPGCPEEKRPACGEEGFAVG